MSLKVLNKKFLVLLRQLSIDLDQFPDKSFDSLFENKQNEQGYFFEWFVDNISSENALTEAEVDVYNYLLKNNLAVTDEELNFAFTKYTPTYEDLKVLNDSYIKCSLVEELEDLNKEYQHLQNISSDLDAKFSSLKTKPNSLFEECNRYKKKQNHIAEELQQINSSFAIIYKEISNFNLSDVLKTMCIQDFKNALDEGCDLNFMLTMRNMEASRMNSFSGAENTEIQKLKSELETSSYLSVVSKGFSEEIKFKTLKAEEFLHKLKDEGDTFDEVFNIWCNATCLKTYDNSVKKVKLLQCNELYRELQKDCELMWHCFLSQSYSFDFCENKMKFSKYLEYLDRKKCDVACNIMLLQVLNKAIENEKRYCQLFDKLYYLVNKSWDKEKDTVDTLNYKNNRYKERFSINEKHALLLSCKKINAGKSPEKNIYINRVCSDVKLLIDDPCFCPDQLFGKLEQRITSYMSDVVNGPTNQIQMAPIQLQLDLSKCKQLLSELSHSVQRLLTEYVNIKESASSNDRRHILLWIDFLTNPKGLTAGLQELQSRSVKCLTNVTAMKI
ncbi:UNVERIFIED_CONTAM: hypothetical protein PYX00_000048 [Menopon gallinae]|uniref:HAUS augmin-like complex subunit 3 N-terminal domain-containing protein n=1 Tax=Menopon gallinae TaxID=328185 RepID=A0AAW2I8M8_9NEOP